MTERQALACIARIDSVALRERVARILWWDHVDRLSGGAPATDGWRRLLRAANVAGEDHQDVPRERVEKELLRCGYSPRRAHNRLWPIHGRWRVQP